MHLPVAFCSPDWRKKGWEALGLTWFLGHHGDNQSPITIISHTGGTWGYTCNLLVMKEIKFVFVVFCNTMETGQAELTNLAIQILVPVLIRQESQRRVLREKVFLGKDQIPEKVDLGRFFIPEICGKYEKKIIRKEIEISWNSQRKLTLVETDNKSQIVALLPIWEEGKEKEGDKGQGEEKEKEGDKGKEGEKEKEKEGEKGERKEVKFRIKGGRFTGEVLVYNATEKTINFASMIYSKIQTKK
eukprot:TRINITY_DN1479_c0_g1_i1.p1 TRINITY_DN1479_c0_g1~~TRINITY_DN1479_c0_g1_i1.p1  ORF type:complete len:244 (-),score=87.77 TRINITY_DN1479_c0_g1_i1:14-745(-)